MTESNNNITETNVISAEKEERCEQKNPNDIKQESDELVEENASLGHAAATPVCR